jgi:WD40 repeat protein
MRELKLLLVILVTILFIPGIAVSAEPNRASKIPKLMPQMAHETLTLGGLQNVAVSPNGQQVLTQSADGSASLWDIKTGRQVRRWVRDSSLASIAFSHDGSRVLLGGNQKIFLISIQTGSEQVFTWKGVSPGAAFPATAMAVSLDDQQLVISTYGEAILWDIATGEVSKRFKHSKNYVTDVAFSTDGKWVLTGSEDKNAYLWDVSTGRNVRQFKHKESVKSVAFSPNGRHVLTGMFQRGISLWDAETEKELWHLPKISGIALAFSPDGTHVMTASGLRNPATGDLSPTQFEGLEWPEDIAFSADSKQVLTGSSDNKARLWDVATGRELQRFEGRTNTVKSVAWSRDGKQILTAGYDDKAHLWNTHTGQEVRQFQEQGPADGWTRHNYGSNLWAKYAAFAESAVFSPDGRFVFTGGKDGQAILWNISTGKEVRRFIGHKGAVWSVTFSPDGQQVLTGGGVDGTKGGKGSVRLWNTDTGTQVKQFKGHDAAVVSVAFSPSGKQLLTASLQDKTVRLWNIKTGKVIKQFKDLTNVSSVAFSPDGMQLLIAHWSGVTLWNINGKKIWQHPGGNPYDVAFSPDGQYVLLAMKVQVDDSIPVLLNATTGKEKRQFIGHDGYVTSVAFSPKGERILTGSKDHTARIWDTETGKELARLLSFNDGTWAVVDSSGRFDASNGGDIEGLHWVVGLEPIKLSQLKERYYEPGLLAKVLKLNTNGERLREVDVFNKSGITLFPEVTVTHDPSPDDPVLRVRLENRGGGIGKVQILVNGKEVTEDARPHGSNDQEIAVLELEVDLTNNPLMIPGAQNAIEVVAYNGAGYLASLPRGRPKARVRNNQAAEAPALWALIVGVSEYRGNNIDLNYAAKDADDFANALSIAANGHKGFKKVNIITLTDSTTPATRDNLRNAFKSLKQAKPTDILVVYLAGHGITWGGAEGDYYYLLQDASSMELKDKLVREQVAVSSRELTEWIKAVPALKQAFILDTCASGQAILGLTASRTVSASQTRSLDRMKDRTGMFVLAGSAADAVSYEASEYGQGLLTYSLLEGMKGAALGIDGFVDVQKLFSHAIERVPQLAGDLGGIQQPRLAVPRGGESFDVGQLQATERDQIPLSQKRPLVLRTHFEDAKLWRDKLKFGDKVNGALREISSSGRNAPLVFVETDEFSNAYRLSGRYSVNNNLIEVTIRVSRGEEDIRTFKVQGQKKKLADLASQIAKNVQEIVTKNH